MCSPPHQKVAGTDEAPTTPKSETRPQSKRSLADCKQEPFDIVSALPHALGQEKAVLSVFLQHPNKLAEPHGLTAGTFYNPAHQILFRHFLDIAEDGTPEDVEIVALVQRLIDMGQLEAVGGPAAITEIACYCPSASHFAAHCQTLHEKHGERLLVLAGIAAMNGDEAEHDRLMQKRHAVMQATSGGMGSIISARAFDACNPPADPAPMVRLGPHGIFTPGNVNVIIADRKAGKSSCVAAIVAAIIAPPHSQGDFLGFTAENPAGKAVLHFDTEQSPADHHKMILRALRRAGIQQPPPWFSSYSLTGLSLADRNRFIDHVCEREAMKHGGLQAVIVDGIADLCRDPNDQGESFDLVDKWHLYSVNKSCVVLAVIHLNPGTEKSRGHLGSQLERKAETPLMIKKNAAGICTMFSTRARAAHFPESEGFSFQWCDNEKMHVSISKDVRNRAKDEHKRNKAADQANCIMAGLPPMSYSGLVVAIEIKSAVAQRTAKNRIKDWLESGIITKHKNGTYALAD